eukprot:1487975-Rhodomonas_salina.3
MSPTRQNNRIIPQTCYFFSTSLQPFTAHLPSLVCLFARTNLPPSGARRGLRAMAVLKREHLLLASSCVVGGVLLASAVKRLFYYPFPGPRERGPLGPKQVTSLRKTMEILYEKYSAGLPSILLRVSHVVMEGMLTCAVAVRRRNFSCQPTFTRAADCCAGERG